MDYKTPRKCQSMYTCFQVTFSIGSNCPSCVTADALPPRYYQCPSDCPLISAQYLTWSLDGSSVYPDDVNTVQGGVLPPPGNVFHGTTVSNSFEMIPVQYVDSTTTVQLTGYRLKLSDISVALYSAFATKYGNQLGDFNPNTDLPLFLNYITNGEFVSATTTNSITLDFYLPQSVTALEIYIYPIQTWLDLYGIMGGIVSATTTVFVAVMVGLEKYNSKAFQDRLRKIRALANRVSLSLSRRFSRSNSRHDAKNVLENIDVSVMGDNSIEIVERQRGTHTSPSTPSTYELGHKPAPSSPAEPQHYGNNRRRVTDSHPQPLK